MAVQEIKEFLQKDGSEVLKVILAPTKKFPEGSYFYCDAEDIDIVEMYTWYVHQGYKNFYITARCLHEDKIVFHQKLALKKLGYYVDCIDHYNHVGFDNIDNNLYIVSTSENKQNSFIKGYIRDKRKLKSTWQVISKGNIALFKSMAKDEVTACKLRYQFERERCTHPYTILVDRSQSLDILDLERTGQISADEATYRHVLKYADNAWYYHRYNLEEYFRDNNIPVPKYALDLQGYMIHPITGEKLCPLTK